MQRKWILILIFLILSSRCKEEKKFVDEEMIKSLAALNVSVHWDKNELIVDGIRYMILFSMDIPVYNLESEHLKEILDKIINVYLKIPDRGGDDVNIGYRLLKMSMNFGEGGKIRVAITCKGKYPKYLLFTDITDEVDSLRYMLEHNGWSSIPEFIRQKRGILFYRGFHIIIESNRNLGSIMKRTGLYLLMPIAIVNKNSAFFIDDSEDFSVYFQIDKDKIKYEGAYTTIERFSTMIEYYLPYEWKDN